MSEELIPCPFLGHPAQWCGDTTSIDLGASHICHLIICECGTFDLVAEDPNANQEDMGELRAYLAKKWNTRHG